MSKREIILIDNFMWYGKIDSKVNFFSKADSLNYLQKPLFSFSKSRMYYLDILESICNKEGHINRECGDREKICKYCGKIS